MKKIGCFISSHGFGHAARMSGVLQSLVKRADIIPHVFTTVPKEFFLQSSLNVVYHKSTTDVGFSQSDAFQIDVEKTLCNLKEFYPISEERVAPFAEICNDCALIVCDIAPMGIKVGQKVNVPTVLIENFTWDFLYTPYKQKSTELSFFIDYLQECYAEADYRIQTEPVCRRQPCDLQCPPIFRHQHTGPEIIRKKLNLSSKKVILITLGGISFTPSFIDTLKNYNDFYFIIGGQEKGGFFENILLLDHFTSPYHPDLIGCADLVVFKSGYSTMAECYQAGVPSIFIQREGFRESEFLESYAQKHMSSHLISQKDFSSGKWLELLENIFYNQPPRSPAPVNGADMAADFLAELL